ncbi:HD domain-containing protein [Candidatus Roizmanbacteria bacterium]|nr:HD domain-containing protein [Candidatus Roizmanbacteria bacterium]
MIITDHLYGKIVVDNPVITALLRSQPLTRLKKIAQFGVPDEFYHHKNYSRYEHSIGVFLLLKKLGASDEEQMAGLIHDVSHTAFSHVVDWLLDSGAVENYQDIHHDEFIRNSEISTILERYGVNAKQIAKLHNFTLLDRDLPNLCADRIDYALREFPPAITQTCIAGLTVKHNKIVYQDAKAAYLFAHHFLLLQQHHWGDYEAVVRYFLFSRVLRRALRLTIIQFDDFMKEDDFIVKKLTASNDPYIQDKLALLRKKSLRNLAKGTKVMHKKFRYVDPEIVSGSQLVRLNIVHPLFRKELEQTRQENEKGIVLPLLSDETL